MLQGANSFYAVLSPLAYGHYEVCPDFVLITPSVNLSGAVGLGHGVRRDVYEEKIKLGRNQFQPRRLYRWAGVFHPAGPAARHSHGPLVAFWGHFF